MQERFEQVGQRRVEIARYGEILELAFPGAWDEAGIEATLSQFEEIATDVEGAAAKAQGRQEGE